MATGNHATGVVSAERARALCEKFQERYEVFLNMNQRAYRKGLGKANARLMLAELERGDSLHWFLMVTDGEHAAHKLEKLKDALAQGERVHVSGYELLKLPHSKAAGGGVRLTWRMTTETERQWRFQIRSTVRSRRADDLHRPGAIALPDTGISHNPVSGRQARGVPVGGVGTLGPQGRGAALAECPALRATHGRRKFHAG